MIWRVVYMGTAEIACPPLRVLAGMPEIELAAVYTQPDRPRGRGQSVRFSPVKKLALEMGEAVLQPESLKSSLAFKELASLKPDVLVVMAYGQILSQQVLIYAARRGEPSCFTPTTPPRCLPDSASHSCWGYRDWGDPHANGGWS